MPKSTDPNHIGFLRDKIVEILLETAETHNQTITATQETPDGQEELEVSEGQILFGGPTTGFIMTEISEKNMTFARLGKLLDAAVVMNS